MYFFFFTENKNSSFTPASSYIVLNTESSYVWYGRLGHMNLRSIQKLTNNLVSKLKIDPRNPTLRFVPKLNSLGNLLNLFLIEIRTQILELKHSGVCNSNREPTRGESHYFVTFKNDYSKCCYIYLLKIKDEVINKFKAFKVDTENQLWKRNKIIQSDREGEYTLNELNLYCEEY